MKHQLSRQLIYCSFKLNVSTSIRNKKSKQLISILETTIGSTPVKINTMMVTKMTNHIEVNSFADILLYFLQFKHLTRLPIFLNALQRDIL